MSGGSVLFWRSVAPKEAHILPDLRGFNGAFRGFPTALGEAVADAGDVNNDGFHDILIGAGSMSTGLLDNNGVAFVYSGADGSLLYQFEGLDDEDGLGSAVGGAGDVNNDGFDDVILGAYKTTVGFNTNVGTSYVHSGFDGSLLYSWTGVAQWDMYARSVDGAGDVNQDGFDDLIVGEREASPLGLADAGRVFVYSGADGSVLYEWHGAASADYLGTSVAGAGDLNADGYDDVILGAFGTDPSGMIWAGSAYAYSGFDGSLLHQWDGSAAVDYFGTSVDTAGDLNGDGKDDVIVGATNSDSGALNAGSAYAYSGADGSLLFQWDSSGVNDYSGQSVSGGHDFNADGVPDCLVGAYAFYVPGIGDAGTAYLYSGADGSLLKQWLGTEFGDELGAAVALLPDVTGDGRAEAILGARSAGPSAEGEVYVQAFNPFLSTNAATVSIPVGLPSSLIGLTVYFAAIASPAAGLPDYSSVAATLEFVP